MCRRIARLFALSSLAFALTLAVSRSAAAGGQDISPPPPRAYASLEREIYRCFDQKGYAKAIELIERHVKDEPNDYAMLYNLACAHCLLGDHDAAASALLRAFKAGFNDINHLRRDPDLAPLREHPLYKRILEEADKVANVTSRNAVENWRDTYGTDHYRYESDRARHLNYATALDEHSHNEMRQMLEKQVDQVVGFLFEEGPRHDVLIAIPTPDDAHIFFSGDDSIGGIYQHGLRRLVARDIGGSLRHEFFHALHYAEMERLSQQHPLWIQEGLASLYETYELNDDGAIRFLPNDRQVIAKARAHAGRLLKWKNLFAMSAQDFMEDAPRNYPQVRSIFEFLADRDRLQTWWREYVQHFKEDSTGRMAFELALGMPIEACEREWRKWLVAQPEIDLRINYGDAALGIRAGENSANDGVVIASIITGSAAQRGGLHSGDVIVSADGRSTRSLTDLRQIVAGKEVGETIQVRIRRKSEYLTVTLTLRPLTGGM